ncbi:hypothetical protein [Blastococcus xanthinilyticus]|uniref:Uncharacterized protein n=1 Tax=Blastococcus xanthinilyticus TaxID=1564164 RepID=A0A5S5CKQ4_9ACTN|nr:hypothetical protein [Blastococcus xanthinilyticus]TYP81153.1 hypothetical protein BD833_1266 [Blastococcus xanthinilyticus]
MPTFDVRRPDAPDRAVSPPGPGTPAEQDEYSPAFAALALLLTTGILIVLVVAAWILEGL